MDNTASTSQFMQKPLTKGNNMGFSADLSIFIFIVTPIITIFICLQLREVRRKHNIKNLPLPPGCMDKFRAHHPRLGDADCALVELGLRQFFLAWYQCGNNFIAMPSQVVDDLWHEFILFTHAYEQFCQQAFGEFLHHSPAADKRSANKINAGLRLCWQHICAADNIDQNNPAHLPLLFAIDQQLNIQNGFNYTLNPPSWEKSPRIITLLATGALSLVTADDISPRGIHGRLKKMEPDDGKGWVSDGCGAGCGGAGCGGCGG